jgi:hypothetical protein
MKALSRFQRKRTISLVAAKWSFPEINGSLRALLARYGLCNIPAEGGEDSAIRLNQGLVTLALDGLAVARSFHGNRFLVLLVPSETAHQASIKAFSPRTPFMWITFTLTR